MKNIGVILSGCGIYDGSEIQEVVLTLLSIDKAGASPFCFAPDIPQYHVIDHTSGEVMTGEKRNVLVESARICRGNIMDLKKIDSVELDALIIPGGYGAAKNLSDYAIRNAEFDVIPDVAKVVDSFHRAGKPIGFICIAPVIAARLLGSEHVELTVGSHRQTVADIESLGARNVDVGVEDIVVSTQCKVVSTPAYMLGQSIGEVAAGIDALVRKVVELS
ncbi:MAG: isoprenoid biosynthesis glyoxalase ElbB [Chlorobiaceae bacterium]|nr:isoprenoid biosynthesis glyoxalase ElbB [Chlorobiaceae bacterium]NTW74397.1 isoprenoid biosynthesis glyoxalase ElbB [Chlorobiaceae bacterium]